MFVWQRTYEGKYEYEYRRSTMQYTGWYRCVNGRQTDGRWLECSSITGDLRYRFPDGHTEPA